MLQSKGNQQNVFVNFLFSLLCKYTFIFLTSAPTILLSKIFFTYYFMSISLSY